MYVSIYVCVETGANSIYKLMQSEVYTFFNVYLLKVFYWHWQCNNCGSSICPWLTLFCMEHETHNITDDLPLQELKDITFQGSTNSL